MKRIRMQIARIALAAAVLASPAAAWAACDSSTSPAVVMRLLGKPDEILDSSKERPRPSIVSRIFEYRRAGVRVAWVVDAPVGSPPPYKGWCLLGFVDTTTDTVIQFDLAKTKTRMYR